MNPFLSRSARARSDQRRTERVAVAVPLRCHLTRRRPLLAPPHRRLSRARQPSPPHAATALNSHVQPVTASSRGPRPPRRLVVALPHRSRPRHRGSSPLALWRVHDGRGPPCQDGSRNPARAREGEPSFSPNGPPQRAVASKEVLARLCGKGARPILPDAFTDSIPPPLASPIAGCRRWCVVAVLLLLIPSSRSLRARGLCLSLS